MVDQQGRQSNSADVAQAAARELAAESEQHFRSISADGLAEWTSGYVHSMYAPGSGDTVNHAPERPDA